MRNFKKVKMGHLKLISVIISLSMILGSVMVPFSVYAADSDPSKTLVFDFHKLGVYDKTVSCPAQGTQEGWSILQEPSTPKVSQNLYGLHVENDTKDISISFKFDINENSPYEIRFKSALASGGGICDILVDNIKVGTYDFYSKDFIMSSEIKSIKTIQLSKGTHKLTFKAFDHSDGSWGYRMYPSEFILVKKDKMPEISGIDIKKDKDTLISGQTTQLTAVVNLDDGNICNTDGSKIYYTSENNDIASVDCKGLVTAKKEGSTNIIVRIVFPDESEISGKILINVERLKLKKVYLNMSKMQILEGRSKKLTVSGIMNDGTAADLSKKDTLIKYTCDNSEVVSVDQNGTVTALKAGVANVKVEVKMNDVSVFDSAAIEVISTEAAKCTKTRSTLYTDEMVKNARNNIAKYPWAKSIKDQAVSKADQYLKYSDDVLWNIVTPQSLPRAFMVNQDLGCPNCGRKVYDYGSFPWKFNPLNDPWKIECPSCHTKFPTNDFGAYYKSGLDENGIFNPSLADKSLLKNTLYPEKGEKWGVDDGFGYIDPNGNKYVFIAYYIHWGLWYPGTGVIPNALSALSDAYLYTGDAKYAHAGIILLDRIADVYPSMDLSPYRDEDGYLNSHGGMVGKGKVLGNIHECDLAKVLTEAYDVFFPALKETDVANVIPFLSKKSKEKDLINPKTTVTHIKQNIEEGIIRQIYPAVKNAQINGNRGWLQSALAMAAVTIDDDKASKEWIDFVMKSGDAVLTDQGWKVTGGNVNDTLTTEVDRDGFGYEGSPDYDKTWLDSMILVADALKGYDKYPNADLYKNVKFKKMFDLGYDLMMSGKYTPSIGDSGVTGAPGLKSDLDEVVKAYSVWHEPKYAQYAYYMNGNKIDGIHGDIFSSDPESITKSIQQVIDNEGDLDHMESADLSGFGFAALRDGKSYIQNYGTNYNFINMSIKDANVETKPYTNSGTLQIEANDKGKYISFDFDVPKTDKYELDLKVFKSDSYGIYDIFIDGKKINEIDFYGPNGAKDPQMIGNMELSEGKHEIKFINNGKNENSSNYKMGIIELSILNAHDEIIKQQAIDKGDTQRDFWMYYGRNIYTSHGHADTLNLGIHAFGLDLAPDLGYPENTGEWPQRMEWTRNTISHNTVMVDKMMQSGEWVGIPHHFDDTSNVKIMDVEAPGVYPKDAKNPSGAGQTDLYRRTVAMIKIDDKNSYAIDFFRVKGGSDHYYSFHSAEGTVTVSGLNLIDQTTGTYAGADVPFGKRQDSVAGWNYNGSGFHYLENIQRDNAPQKGFSVDWKVKDTWNVLSKPEDIHLKLTMLNDTKDVALADGIPPQTQPGNPKSLRYLVAHRQGKNLSSQFLSVIEPYKNQSNIKSMEQVSMVSDDKSASSDDAAAIKVTLDNGRVDYIVNSIDPNITYTIDNKFMFKGFMAVCSLNDGKYTYKYLSDGTQLGGITNIAGCVTGKVKDFTRDLSMNNSIKVEFDSQVNDPDSLVGRTIYVDNDKVRNACYVIKAVREVSGNEAVLDIGDATLIRTYVDNSDFSKGYIYDISKDDKFKIPLSVQGLRELDNIALTSDKDSIHMNETVKTNIAGTMDDGSIADLTNAKISYESSRPDFVTFDNSGDIKLIKYDDKVGSIEVWANVTIDGKTVKSNIVKINIKELSNVVISAAKNELNVGDKIPLNISAVLNNNETADLTDARIVYNISCPDVIEVVNGVIIAKKTGMSDITADVTLYGKQVKSNKITIKVIASGNNTGGSGASTNNNGSTGDAVKNLPKTGYPINTSLMLFIGFMITVSGFILINRRSNRDKKVN